jgi:SAM-dependent methyltransferase
VVDPKTHKTGWIVALNIDHVDRRQAYENDLKRTNGEQLLISLHASSAERILRRFPGYSAIVNAHLQVMKAAGARRVLDLGCGPGFLAKKLLAADVAVTSIDDNDAMIALTRRRCRDFSSLSAVKANFERLHAPRQQAPNGFYDLTKIGIQPPYDGACMLNLYQWLRDPPGLFQALLQGRLLSPGAAVTISLCGKEEIEELFGALNCLSRRQSANSWKPEDFVQFSALMRYAIERYVIDHRPTTSAEAVAEDLKAAGYRAVKQSQVAYEIDGQPFKGFPFLVAEAPHE